MQNRTGHLSRYVALALLAAAPGAATACGSRQPEAGDPAGPPLSAEVVTVERHVAPRVIEAGGVVRAQTTAAVTSRLMAPVLEIRVTAGERVRAGQLLVRLDDRDLAAHARRAVSSREAAEQGGRAAGAERTAAAAALALARATHARIAALHGRTSATDQELDGAVAQLRAAEARLAATEARVAEAEAALTSAAAGADAARVSASWATITAPFDGLVTETLVEPGNMAAPGAPLVRLERTGGLRLDVRLDESRAATVRPGDAVRVAIDSFTAPDADAVPAAQAGFEARSAVVTATGRVTEVARAPDAGSHAFLVKVALPPELSVHSGAFGRARFEGPPASALMVPATAVVRHGQLTAVYVAHEQRARLRLVRVGSASEDRVEVLAGLEPGERILRRPPPGLVDGTRLAGGAR